MWQSRSFLFIFKNWDCAVKSRKQKTGNPCGRFGGMTCPNLSLPAPCPPAYPNKNHTVVARCAEHPPNRLFLGRNSFHNDSWGSKDEKYKAGHSLGNLVVKKGQQVFWQCTHCNYVPRFKGKSLRICTTHIVSNCIFPRAKMQNSKFWSYLGRIPMKLMFTWGGRASTREHLVETRGSKHTWLG